MHELVISDAAETDYDLLSYLNDQFNIPGVGCDTLMFLVCFPKCFWRFRIFLLTAGNFHTYSFHTLYSTAAHHSNVHNSTLRPQIDVSSSIYTWLKTFKGEWPELFKKEQWCIAI